MFFWLPLLSIRILAFHTHILHSNATLGIISAMCCCCIRQAVFLHLPYDYLACFRGKSFMPKNFAKTIIKIMVFFNSSGRAGRQGDSNPKGDRRSCPSDDAGALRASTAERDRKVALGPYLPSAPILIYQHFEKTIKFVSMSAFAFE